MTASETWWLVALIVAGVAALLHLASALPARPRTAPPGEVVTVHSSALLAALARALTAAAVGLTALAFLVSPVL